jgi:hypothetical protein
MSSEWVPLEQMLGPELCQRFMYIGRTGEIYLYKHIDTRRYLNLDAKGNAFATQKMDMSRRNAQKLSRTYSANAKFAQERRRREKRRRML